ILVPMYQPHAVGAGKLCWQKLESQDRNGLVWVPSPVSADLLVDPANTGEKPDSCNRNLPGVEYPLGLAGESTARVDSLPDSSARTSASISLMCGFAGEGLLPGIPTWVTDVSAGCWAPETSIK